MIPACGELTLRADLSVSISAIVSSAATLSPTFFSNFIVPSLTDSGKAGVETLNESSVYKTKQNDSKVLSM